MLASSQDARTTSELPRHSPSTSSSRAHHLLDTIPHPPHQPSRWHPPPPPPWRPHPPPPGLYTAASLPRRPCPLAASRCRGAAGALRIARQVAVNGDVSSSSSVVVAEEAAAASKIGKRVRVTAPVRVHHVSKAPDLDPPWYGGRGQAVRPASGRASTSRQSPLQGGVRAQGGWAGQAGTHTYGAVPREDDSWSRSHSGG
ncbi:hypothetical protein GUJ93_ZPchr0014g47113 [Zizania palustris]|uniref:Uncharacterized protein n=1 Tax=Zizania palustris TaxID=103762 RepID=A0A8J5TAH7_ZIZPA|nr:hypothetical protein GUJ93_ZPchr0014g47113 [Zizania palustris]